MRDVLDMEFGDTGSAIAIVHPYVNRPDQRDLGGS